MSSKERITRQYIKDNFDIEKEKKELEGRRTISNLDFTQFDGMTIKEFREEINKILDSFDNDNVVDVQPYGYDGGFEFNIEEIFLYKESDDECIHRLQFEERQRRATQRRLEWAAELLQKNGLYGAIPKID
jgi:molybdopterin synthase catalytic subunit